MLRRAVVATVEARLGDRAADAVNHAEQLHGARAHPGVRPSASFTMTVGLSTSRRLFVGVVGFAVQVEPRQGMCLLEACSPPTRRWKGKPSPTRAAKVARGAAAWRDGGRPVRRSAPELAAPAQHARRRQGEARRPRSQHGQRQVCGGSARAGALQYGQARGAVMMGVAVHALVTAAVGAVVHQLMTATSSTSLALERAERAGGRAS